ncbi:MAG: hypothetical protein DWQ35_20000 [Planctomycetota bacterium]|mgnify:CR=1 FL=1|nr:MAG: hypothetical protein DWQ35_20000 [Planctomycetota bacterium]REK28393.1 MAG: hypothetical protein DWQ42_05300 [Planctomycetota bacterium]REK48409.1 MAG: hypothetical protein DWQ46_02450 [Planctomycetota bacterium]
MDEKTKLLLRSGEGGEATPVEEPVSYEVQSLLEESRNRVYSEEGRRLVDATKSGNGDDEKQKTL